MSTHRTDEMKGRVKQAAGALTGDERLEREGRADRAAGKVKHAAEKVKDRFEDAVDAVRDRFDKDARRDD